MGMGSGEGEPGRGESGTSSPCPRSWAEVQLSRPDSLVMAGWDLGSHSSSNPREDDSWVCQGKEKPPGLREKTEAGRVESSKKMHLV